MRKETKTHSASSVQACQNCKKDFAIEPDDFGFYKKIDVPAPTLCPECRLQRRLLYRNERVFYKRKCDLCGKDTVSMYDKDFETPVYCVKCWWSDNWDPTQYAKEYDPSRSFSEQFEELFYTVPMIAMQNDDGIGSVNCPYTCDFAFGKNSYLVTATWEVENGMYSYHICQCKDVVDSYYSNHCNLSYELVNCHECYGCKYCRYCVSCNDCILGYDLRGCSDCIMSVGLRNKKYCILNKQYSKEEYEVKKKEMQLGNREKLKEYKKQFEELILQYPRRFAHMFKSVGSSGDVLINCKMARDCFYFKNLEECRYFLVGDTGKDSYDCTNTGRVNMCYEGLTPDESYKNITTIYSWKCNQAEYSNNCHGCTSVLGCSALRHGSYSILNKKYSKEDFEKLRTQIIEDMKSRGEWGEFFPANMSPFTYNESSACDWIPLNKQKALKQGFKWRDQKQKNYDVTMKSESIPETISNTPNNIVDEVIECRHRGECEDKCSFAFKITSQELQLYKKMNVPIPELCSNCRYYQRIQLRNPAKLWKRQCECHGSLSGSTAQYKNTVIHFHGDRQCPNEFETSYSPDRKEIVYCENCYQNEII